MTETLELPNGETVTPEDVFLHDGYPYRYVPLEGEYAFALSPVYWGGGGMDVPFRDREALVSQWGEDSRGTLADAEWEAWLRDARGDDRFGEEELDAVARELGVETGTGLATRLRRALGLRSND